MPRIQEELHGVDDLGDPELLAAMEASLLDEAADAGHVGENYDDELKKAIEASLADAEC